jgi:predicted nicotinamide N-methyase
VTVAAMRAGFDVMATDYYADALLFARRNSRSATGREPRTRLVDWRAFPTDLGRFDLLLASDVLYERSYATLVADAIVASLAPGGVALVADPGRVALLSFVTACEQRGLAVGVRARIPWQEGAARQMITIHEVRAAPGA